jgi:hypothetical protein
MAPEGVDRVCSKGTDGMPTFTNIYACLVHERPDCVADLVQNLHHLDPESRILLYNGGATTDLLDEHASPWSRYQAVIHPAPRPMKWGWLHGFALDCMRWALAQGPFDALTIVDSDQLALRPGYSGHLAAHLTGRPAVGLLGSAPPRTGAPKAPPALAAWRERDLWRPFLRKFPDGEQNFAHWTFWPSTVFTAAACQALVSLWDGDRDLRDLMGRSKIWATEEVVLPTLVRLLGFELAESPFRSDYVKYRVKFSRQQLERALANPTAFWMHPVPRHHDDPLRQQIRDHFGGYQRLEATPPPAAPVPERQPPLLRAGRVIAEVRGIEGWLDDDEADLLIAGAARAMSGTEAPPAMVEVGSYCGKATVALGRVVEALRPEARVYAVDPHDGQQGARDRGLQQYPPSLGKLRRTLSMAGLTSRVEVIPARAAELTWDRPLAFLLVDGLHDHAAVAEDFGRFGPHLVEGGLVAFHDHADYYPGVKLFVQELLRGGCFEQVDAAGTMVLLRRCAPGTALTPAPPPEARPVVEVTAERPQVTCIMPTADRRAMVGQAVACFLAQDYPNRELLVVDDGRDPIGDLLPQAPNIRYLRLNARLSIGAKRNLACQQATGQVIAHFDDDDWSAAWRLSYQVAELERERATVCGLNRIYYHQPASGRSWQFIYPSGRRAWLAGNSFCYERQTWLADPFPEIDVGEDARFLWRGRRGRILALERNEFLVALVHQRNVDPKHTSGRYWHPCPTEVLVRATGADLERYRDLTPADRVQELAGTSRSSA